MGADAAGATGNGADGAGFQGSGSTGSKPLVNGTTPALFAFMGARRVEDLFVWRLASETRRSLVEVTAKRSFGPDFKLRSELLESANSIEANISEGFARYTPRDFARFLRYSRASAHELLTHLADAHDRRHITEAELTKYSRNCRRISRALVKLIKYLDGNGLRHAGE